MKITEAAANHVSKQTRNEAGLRISVESGGCSGFRYKFAIDHQDDGDIVLEKKGVLFLIDPLSYEYLKDSELDLVNENLGSALTIKNPAAKSTCGCGTSFSA